MALALFTVHSPFSFSGLSNNEFVAVTDLNKDGRADAVLPNFGTDYTSGAGTTISVLYGSAGGGFSRTNLTTSGQNVSSVAIVDINGDTWPDVVASNVNRLNTGSISIFRNDGAGNLSLVGTPLSTVGFNPSRVSLADVTGDGVPDVVVANTGKDNGSGTTIGNNITVFKGNGDFTFVGTAIATLTPSAAFAPTAITIADLDGDGRPDIAATVPSVPPSSSTPQGTGAVYVFRGTGGGQFASPTQFSSGGYLPVDIHAAYLNGDNKLDLIVADAGDPNVSPEFTGNGIGVLLNTGSAGSINFSATTTISANSHGTFAVVAADFDLDGKIDLAAINYGSLIASSPHAFVSVYLGSGTGTFTAGSPATYDTQTSLSGGQYLAVGDFDANGTPDLIVAHASNVVGELLNTTLPHAPSVVMSQFNYLTSPQSLSFTFDQNVGPSLTLADLTVQRRDTLATITPASLIYNSETNTATVYFSGVLADANYRATLHASGVNNTGNIAMAADYMLDFFVYAGDANHNRTVDVDDLYILASNWYGTGKTFAQGDFNYDGVVDGKDLGILSVRWQQTLAPPAPPAPPLAAAALSSRATSRAPARTAIQLVT